MLIVMILCSITKLKILIDNLFLKKLFNSLTSQYVDNSDTNNFYCVHYIYIVIELVRFIHFS